jgi:cytochrome c-type biogenesis protein CcmH
MNRRRFISRVMVASAAGSTSLAWLTRRLAAQAAQVPTGLDSSNLFAMDQSASRPVRLAPKPGSRVVVSAAERDALEHRIRCQCGCTLDVYTCRTTDFSCQVSPSMHRDVMALVAGGYTAQEILDAFVGVYGQRVLMAPPAAGFNLLGWVAPFAVLGGGTVLVVSLLRRWRRQAPVAPLAAPQTSRPTDATDDELARLEAAVRDDE